MAQEFVILVTLDVNTETQEFRVNRLPFTLGRDTICDVVLSSHFVSGKHAQVESLEGQLHVRDLNSTNGTHVDTADGTRTQIAAQSSFALAECGSQFFLGGRLQIEVRPGAPDPQLEHLPGLTNLPNSPDYSSARIYAGGSANLPSLPGENGPLDVQPSPLGGAGLPSLPGRASPPMSGADAMLPSLPGSASSPLGEAAAVYPAGLASLPGLPGLNSVSSADPAPNSASGSGAPHSPAAFSPLATGNFQLSMEQLALQGLHELAASLNPGQTLASQGDVARLVTRLHDIVEMTAKAYVTLRQGYEQLARAVHVTPLVPGHDLATIQGASGVAAALVGTGPRKNSAHEEAERGFRQVASHQVALLDGLAEGVKAVLNELSPQVIESHASQKRKGFALSGQHKALWESFCLQHQELSVSNRAIQRLFGDEFAAAYQRYQERQ